MTDQQQQQQQHQITPPPELVKEWCNSISPDPTSSGQQLATAAARWGADQELDSCCEWVYRQFTFGSQWSRDLRVARRPKPQSMKEQALTVLDDLKIDATHYNILRNALEQLDD